MAQQFNRAEIESSNESSPNGHPGRLSGQEQDARFLWSSFHSISSSSLKYLTFPIPPLSFIVSFLTPYFISLILFDLVKWLTYAYEEGATQNHLLRFLLFCRNTVIFFSYLPFYIFRTISTPRLLSMGLLLLSGNPLQTRQTRKRMPITSCGKHFSTYDATRTHIIHVHKMTKRAASWRRCRLSRNRKNNVLSHAQKRDAIVGWQQPTLCANIYELYAK